MADEKDKKLTVEERLAAMEAALAEKDEQIAVLQEKAKSPYEKKDEFNGPGNPNKMLYKGGKHQQFHPADVKAAMKDGWVDNPNPKK